MVYWVVLLFPDSESLASFVIQEQISGIETNNREYALVGQLTEEQIKIARKKHNAYVRVARKVL